MRSRAIELATVGGFCAFLFFFGLGAFGLVGADEPRYAQIAREMLGRGDIVTPVLHGEPWLEKPVLYYWGAMLSYAVFGVHDWAARAPVAALASAMVGFVYFFVLRLRPGAQMDAALITASSAAVIGFARGASTDMPLAATFTMAMLAWYGWYESGRRGWLAGFYFLLAISTLAKGPVAVVLAALVILPFAFLQRRERPAGELIRGMLWLPGIVLFLAAALPWYVAVQMRNPEFFRVFILEHNLLRYGTELYRHTQPFWFYAPVLLLSLLPWTALALAAAVDVVRRWAGGRRLPRIPDPLSLFLLTWAIAPVLFFSLSGSKLPGYILPAIPAYTVLTALYVRRRSEEGARPHAALLAVHAVLGGIVLGAVLLLPNLMLLLSPPRTGALAAVLVGAAVSIAMYASLRRRGLQVVRFVTMVPVILGVAFILRAAAPAIDARESARPIAQRLDAMQAGAADVAVHGVSRHVEYGLGFYLDQPIERYERGEVPAGDHLVVTRAGSRAQVQQYAADRRLSPVGGYSPRAVEFFWVSAREHQH